MDATTEGIGRGERKGHPHAAPRRRPSGEPPALPRELGRSGKFFLLMVLYFILVITGFLLFPTLEGSSSAGTTAGNSGSRISGPPGSPA